MIKLGLLGLGNVGQGVVDILSENDAHIEARVGDQIQVKSIAVRNIDKYKNVNIGNATLSTDVNTILNDPEISIVVELMGGEYPAYDYICQALKNGKYVVTANKEVVSKHKETFFKLAKENNVDIYFEAAVGGGIPIIRSLKVGLAANRIESIFGILNGTTNYILSKIEDEQKDFSVILKNAQELGLAEADPTMDVEGIDAAHKLVILAAVAFKANVQLDDLYYEGITHITLKDIQYAKELGYVIKLLAIGHKHSQDHVSLRVHPTLIPNTHLLASIRNEVNAAYVVGNAVGEVLLSGKGAGGSPTGSAVVSDIIDIAFDVSHKLNRRNLEAELYNVTVSNMSDTQSQYYLRLTLSDKPNMLETISKVIGEYNINIAKIVQKECIDDEAELVILTDETQESTMQDAKAKLESLDGVSIKSFIRAGVKE
jgi:homoserine dehydrogenase